jgi:fructose-specific PTS system IIB-like component
MAAESLSVAAKAAGCEIQVETQGGIGTENALSADSIRMADYVILSKEVAIKDEERFAGKRIARVAIADLIKKPEVVIGQLRNHYQTLSA